MNHLLWKTQHEITYKALVVDHTQKYLEISGSITELDIKLGLNVWGFQFVVGVVLKFKNLTNTYSTSNFPKFYLLKLIKKYNLRSGEYAVNTQREYETFLLDALNVLLASHTRQI